MSEPVMVYVARPACGCIVRVFVETARDRGQLARDLARAVRDGLSLQRIELERVRRMKLGCIHQGKRTAEPSTQSGMELDVSA